MVQAHTRLVGRYAKLQAFQAAKSSYLFGFGVLLGGLWFTGLLTGLIIRLSLSGPVWVAVGLASLALWALVAFTALRLLDRVMDRAAQRRLNIMRGGMAEAYVSMRLRDNLSDRWHLWDNLQLEGHGDIDHVLLGPGGLFVISTKARRGRFQSTPGDATSGGSGTSGGPRFNDEPTGWVRQALSQAVDVRKAMALMADDPQANPGKPPWAQAVLALPFAHIDAPPALDPDGRPLGRNPKLPGVGKCWVLNDDDLLNAIAPEPIPKPRKLTKPEVDRWAAALQKLYERHMPASAVSESD